MKIPYYQKIHSIVIRVSIWIHGNQHTQRTDKESKVIFILILTLSEIIGQTSDK